MRIAVLSDVHANAPALACVLEDIESWRPDHVVVNGDVVNRGPRPLRCWQMIAKRLERPHWHIVKGNHEDYVTAHRRPAREPTEEDKIHRGSHWTAGRLGMAVVDRLATLPDQVSIDAGAGGEVRFLHASMRGNRDGIYPDTDDATLRKQITPAPRLFAAAHTHRPLIRWWRDTLVVNSGSVGLPFDRDRRAAYARLTYHNDRWTAVIMRREYDWQRAYDDYADSGFLPDGGPLVRLHRIEFRDAVSHIHLWSPRYLDAVLDGTLTLEDAVEAYIARYVDAPR